MKFETKMSVLEVLWCSTAKISSIIKEKSTVDAVATRRSVYLVRLKRVERSVYRDVEVTASIGATVYLAVCGTHVNGGGYKSTLK